MEGSADVTVRDSARESEEALTAGAVGAVSGEDTVTAVERPEASVSGPAPELSVTRRANE